MSSATATALSAYDVAASVTDPEMPMLTLEDLGVLRDVQESMRDDLLHKLTDAGYDARVKVSLSPAWSSDWITERGREALRAHGLSAPGRAPRADGPIALSLSPTRRRLSCPRCGSADVELTSEFGATACKALYRCTSCLEPFEHVKEI